MTTPTGNGGPPGRAAPPCITGTRPHAMIHRRLVPGGEFVQACAMCGMTPIQARMNGYDRVIVSLLEAVGLLLQAKYDTVASPPDWREVTRRLVVAGQYSGHIAVSEDGQQQGGITA